MPQLLPDRPIPAWQKPIRSLVRQLRLACHRLLVGKKLKFGRNVNLGRRIEIRSPHRFIVADNVSIGPYFIAEANVEVGPDVLISSRVSFISNDHAFDDPTKTVYYGGRLEPSTIVLEGDNLIGFGSIVVGNVRIGKGCIVGAGSVVTRDLPPYTVCAGVPARVLRSRYPQEQDTSSSRL